MTQNLCRNKTSLLSIPVFTSSVTKPKNSANLEGRGQSANFVKLDFMVKSGGMKKFLGYLFLVDIDTETVKIL